MNIINRNVGELTFYEVNEILNSETSHKLLSYNELMETIESVKQKLVELGDIPSDSLSNLEKKRFKRIVSPPDEPKVFEYRNKLTHLNSLRHSCFVYSQTKKYLARKIVNQDRQSIVQFRKKIHSMIPNLTTQEELQIINLRPNMKPVLDLIVSDLSNRVNSDNILGELIKLVEEFFPSPEEDDGDSEDDGIEGSEEDSEAESEEDEEEEEQMIPTGETNIGQIEAEDDEEVEDDEEEEEEEDDN